MNYRDLDCSMNSLIVYIPLLGYTSYLHTTCARLAPTSSCIYYVCLEFTYCKSDWLTGGPLFLVEDLQVFYRGL